MTSSSKKRVGLGEMRMMRVVPLGKRLDEDIEKKDVTWCWRGLQGPKRRWKRDHYAGVTRRGREGGLD